MNDLTNEIVRLTRELAEVRRERDAAFAMSKCECRADEGCQNIVQARDKALEDAAEVAKAHAVDFERQARWKQNMHECDAFITASNACYRTADDILELKGN